MVQELMLRTFLAAAENTVGSLAIKATLTLVVGLLLLRALRRSAASLRHLITVATFGVLLLLPIAASLIPVRGITVAAAPTMARAAEVVVAPAGRLSDRATPATQLSRSPLPRVDGMRILVAVYFGGVVWIGSMLLIGIGRVVRLRRDAEVWVTGTGLANAMARECGQNTGIEVMISPWLAVPMTFGCGRPVILLPASAESWTEVELRRALRHELEHISRSDWSTQLMSCLACALYWPHPLVWPLWRRLRLEAERACDDAVIRDQVGGVPYAEQLVTLARSLTGHSSVPALAMATRSNLGQRVEAILDRGLRRTPLSPFRSVAVIAVAVAGILAIAPVRVLTADVKRGEAMRDVDVRGDEDAGPLDEALFEAAGEGDLAEMEKLIQQGARSNVAISGDGTPLMAAARRGHLDAMELLLARGANVNRGVSGDGTALIVAAARGHLNAVRLLLDRGAEIDRGIPGDGNALIMAAGHGHAEVVRFLLDRGADIERVVPGDENALIHASESGQAEVVRLLIDRGANVNARVWVDWANDERRGEWRTPMSMARRGRHEAVLGILRAAGARE